MAALPRSLYTRGFASSPSESNKKEHVPFKTERLLAAGAGAGALTKTSVAPMERLKVIFQTAGMRNCSKYTSVGIQRSLSIIFHEEGLRGFFKGNGANCARVVPVYAIKFSLNDSFKEMLLEARSTGAPSLEPLSLTFTEKMLAGSMAGVVQVLATYPLDLIRTRLQLAETMGAKYKGILDCGVSTFRREGSRGLYKGMVPSLLAGVPYVGLQMSFYDTLKIHLAPHLPKNADGSTSILAMLACGSVAGLTAQTITFPADTVRHCMQANGISGQDNVYSSTLDCFNKIYLKEGVRGFFKGWGLNLVRSLPGAAVQFTSYDILKKLFGVPS
mmetsp:Transcript_18411/g.25515  ORF Transcript_18411/g.25515 Transcript_18411/m.25515 type:complete len:330 (-) Transcript_18411:137-1126(-)|eukprot:CAMPEP_0196586302 /NCGR_PEP_ID=MMETSP1081-20130531/53797_1 /TAXON_ID=36882 /ORGANISM="Pyramimonas amylifera, Strain CCMP720" /LENGTH=329 /DNA_ID=CAMNT_0041908135 /DNA_START=286 /DNA_END=1275 /DNA_ORIENTATION=-